MGCFGQVGVGCCILLWLIRLSLAVRNERIMRSMSVSGCAKQARFRERKSNITMVVPGELSAYRAYHHQRTSLACARWDLLAARFTVSQCTWETGTLPSNLAADHCRAWITMFRCIKFRGILDGKYGSTQLAIEVSMSEWTLNPHENKRIVQWFHHSKCVSICALGGGKEKWDWPQSQKRGMVSPKPS